MWQKYMVLITIIIFIVGMIGCIENNSKKIVGAWEGVSITENDSNEVIFTFYEDNTAMQEGQESHVHWFYYELDDKCLYLTLQEFPDVPPICYNYEFSNNYHNLTLINESYDTLKLTKIISNKL